MNHRRTLIRAAMIADGDGRKFAPGAIMLVGKKIKAAGSPQQVGTTGADDCRVLDLPRSVVIPALVNAHAHLDLTHIGPIPPADEFTQWVKIVRSRRATTDSQIDESVRLGIGRSRAGGTAIIGDIAGVGSTQPIKSMRNAGMAGVSFLEVFGLGNSKSKAIQRMQEVAKSIASCEANVALGVQPHAPYSCGLDVYRAAAALDLPLSTHLAETIEELEFVDSATGPIAHMLRDFGAWNDGEGIQPTGKHPIDLLEPVLRERSMLAAHVNYIDDRHLEMLSRLRVSIAYCPRASAYFGHPHNGEPPHRYREMLEAGINVALGTDSILCLDTPDRISVLDEMRFLYRRDGTDPFTLLRMATVNGATALGFDSALVTLAPGEIAGLLAIDLESAQSSDPLVAALANNSPPCWIA